VAQLTRQRVFPTGARIRVDEDHSVHFLVGEREYNQHPWAYDEVKGALAYLPNGELVVITGRLPNYILENLGRIRWVGTRLFSNLFDKAAPQPQSGLPPYLRR
jgi:hypothetical protein